MTGRAVDEGELVASPVTRADRRVEGVDYASVFAALPTAYLVMTPDLVIAECNAAYAALIGRPREELLGQPVFEAFPPAPDALDERGVPRIGVSFERARDTGLMDVMPIEKYDIVDAEGRMTERYWSLISAPVLDASGTTRLILQRVEDVTDYVQERQRSEAHKRQGDVWQRRVEEVEADLYVRAQELSAAVEERDLVARRVAGLADAALQLAVAETVRDLCEIVTGAGLAALGADGGAIGVRDAERDVLWLTLSDSLGAEAQRDYAEVPLDAALPACLAARTGERVLIRDAASGRAFSPEMAQAHEATGRQAFAAVPLQVGGRLLGSVTVSWAEVQEFDDDEVEVLEAFAAQCAQALDRLQVREAELALAAQTRKMSEALQRSLLTAPPEPDHLQIAVRYQTATRDAQVGGDWYDAFLTPDGSTTLVVGDVTGHDRNAAVAMAQVRNVLRGVAQSVAQPPAAVLTALDRALGNLGVDTLATAVLAQIHQDDAQAAQGQRAFTWSSAGHPPPLLLLPDGSTELMDSAADLLLGLAPGSDRTDHEVVLPPGATVLLYTDGLVERRGEHLDAGLERLRALVARLAGGTLEQLLTGLVDALGQDLEDDVALLAVRLHPEDRPRPPEAGPGVLPPRHEAPS